MSVSLSNIPNITYVDKAIQDNKKAVTNLRNLYTTELVVNEDQTDAFRIPFNDFFLKYRNQLNDIVEWYAIPEAYFYQPKTVSFNLYGTTDLWIALLRVNNMKNITEFHYPLIRIYNASALKELINIFFKRDKIIT